MPATFKTTLLDRALRQKRRDNERKRREAIEQAMRLLSKLSAQYAIERAFLFGSVARPGRFRERSDVDIAVFGLSDEKYFAFMGELSRQLSRDVDVIQMEKHYLKDRIRGPKIVWKKSA